MVQWPISPLEIRTDEEGNRWWPSSKLLFVDGKLHQLHKKFVPGAKIDNMPMKYFPVDSV